MKRFLQWEPPFLLLAFIGLVVAFVIYHSHVERVEKAEIIAKVTYACKESMSIEATYYRGKDIPGTPEHPPVPGGSVSLILSDGRTVELPQTISGSGIRYASADESLVFWSKGESAFITESGTTTYADCLMQQQ